MLRRKYTDFHLLESVLRKGTMSPETITIVIAIIGTGIVLAGLTVPSLRELRRGVGGIHRDMADLRERMARLEGLFEGFTRREPAAPGTGTT